MAPPREMEIITTTSAKSPSTTALIISVCRQRLIVEEREMFRLSEAAKEGN